MTKVRPKEVGAAIALVWASLGLGVLTSLAARLASGKPLPEFWAELLVMGLLAVIPYKLGKGSNAARVAFAVLSFLSLVWAIGGGLAELSRIEVVMNVIQFPITAVAVVLLFLKPSRAWFQS